MARGDNKVFAVLDEAGKVTRLVEAKTAAQVKEHILRSANVYEITVASALTVARAGMEVEKAE